MQVPIVVDHQKLFDAVCMKDASGLLERDPGLRGHQLLVGHHFPDLASEVLFEAKVTIGENADQALIFGYRKPGNTSFLHQREGFGQGFVRAYCQRVRHHPAFEFLHAGDLPCLSVHGKVLVDETQAALLRHRNRCPGFRDGIHRRADQRDRQGDLASEARADPRIARQDLCSGRDQQNVIKSEAFAKPVLFHFQPPKSEEPGCGTELADAPY